MARSNEGCGESPGDDSPGPAEGPTGRGGAGGLEPSESLAIDEDGEAGPVTVADEGSGTPLDVSFDPNGESGRPDDVLVDPIELGTTLALSDPNFLRPSYPSSLVQKEEDIWRSIVSLRGRGADYEGRASLAQAYSQLAYLYNLVGSPREAINLISKALENRPDKQLLRLQARLYAQEKDARFIVLFQRLLKEDDDLQTVMEYCFSLERMKLHNMALDVFQRSLERRPRGRPTWS